MQVTIARQLGLDPSTVSNFFMNARRRSVDKWKDDKADAEIKGDPMDDMGMEPMDDDMDPTMTPPPMSRGHLGHFDHQLKATPTNAVLVAAANPAAVVQHLQQPQEATLTPTAALDL